MQRNLNSKSDRLIDGGHTLMPLEPHFFIDLESLFSGKKILKLLMIINDVYHIKEYGPEEIGAPCFFV